MLNNNQKHVMRGQTVYTEEQVKRRIEEALQNERLKAKVVTPSAREMLQWVHKHLGITELNSESTPSSQWSVKGEPDFHPDLINKERGSLMLGSYTDDELANAIFMWGNPSDREKHERLLKGEIMDIAYLTAGKERIRWLSRHLEVSLKKIQELTARVKELEDVPNVIGE